MQTLRIEELGRGVGSGASAEKALEETAKII
jgi:hypothetical protein